MREIKILAVVVFFTAIVYWGVEPFAHSQMHPHVAPADFNYAQEDEDLLKHEISNLKEEEKNAQEYLDKVSKSKDEDHIKNAQKSLEVAKKNIKDKEEELARYTEFWKGIDSIDFAKGNAQKGKEVFDNAGCAGCHGLKAAGIEAPMDDASASASFGVVPPDLSTAGYLYGDHFLAALIKDPVVALKLTHKFNDSKPFPMPGFFGAGGDLNQELADIVAYLKSVSPKEVSDKKVFQDACERCHDMKYDNLVSPGDHSALASYLGSLPPDLSMVIRSKGEDYLQTFINDPQKQLLGTAMPRVGLDEKSQEQVISYLEKIGDRKKEQREDLGIKIMIYFAILSIFAILWKNSVWRELH